MKNDSFRSEGFILIIAGLFLMIVQPFAPITGAVIDTSTISTKVNFFLSIFLIALGAFIVHSSK